MGPNFTKRSHGDHDVIRAAQMRVVLARNIIREFVGVETETATFQFQILCSWEDLK